MAAPSAQEDLPPAHGCSHGTRSSHPNQQGRLERRRERRHSRQVRHRAARALGGAC